MKRTGITSGGGTLGLTPSKCTDSSMASTGLFNSRMPHVLLDPLFQAIPELGPTVTRPICKFLESTLT